MAEISSEGRSKLTVIIPARNEAECLPGVLKELPENIVNEILVVDGHSTDGTPEVVRQLGFEVVVQEGKGYGLGVETGIRHAKGDLVTFLDADGSYDPEALYRLKAEIEEGYDVVFCSRYLPESGSDDDTLVRFIGNKIFTLLLRWIHGVRVSDALFLYVMARKEVIKDLPMTSKGFDWCIEFPIRVHRANLRYTEIPSRERPRVAGDSKVNAFSDGLKILFKMLVLRFK